MIAVLAALAIGLVILTIVLDEKEIAYETHSVDDLNFVNELVARHINKKDAMRYVIILQNDGYETLDQLLKTNRAQLLKLGIKQGHVDQILLPKNVPRTATTTDAAASFPAANPVADPTANPSPILPLTPPPTPAFTPPPTLPLSPLL